MAIPFSRSLRSMQQDRFQPGMIAIILICLVLLFWIIWFFTGELPIYATTANYQVRDDGRLFASFSAGSLQQIVPGQQAELILPSQAGKPVDPIEAEVMNVPTGTDEPVEIYLFTNEFPATPDKGHLKVLVGRTSPAKLIWRSIQQ